MQYELVMIVERIEDDLSPSNLNAGEAAMVKAKYTSERYKTLSEALNIIDPQGKIEPGTVEHNTVTETILSWMDKMEPHEVLRKSETARLISPLRRSAPRTKQYKTIKAMIQDWIDQHGPEKALDMARTSAKYLDGRRKQL